MIVKIENPAYTYQGNGIVSVSATVTIYADDGVTVLHKKGISTSANTNDPSVDATSGELVWKLNVLNSLTKQAQDIVDVYTATMKAVVAAWPTAVVPQDALDAIAATVQTNVTIPV